MSGDLKKYIVRIAIVAAVSAPLGLLAPVANAAQLVAPQKVSYEDAVPGIAPPNAPPASTPPDAAQTNQPALSCTPETFGDNPHLSSTPGVISAHGWWKQGNCSNNKATVENCLYEFYTDGTWRRKACNTASGIFPGGGSANRSAANRACDSTQTISWRNRVDVDVDGELDTSETIDRQADVNCAINGDDQ
ncbi:hypothetical protein OG943_30855 [Amycolatopsis sp. NBC_00345]|uniref:hypothetical protein n=1 Tax=Amycolatopsis sp. NBC_00345 TaxID=2975955 RepID=UPI002E25918E